MIAIGLVVYCLITLLAFFMSTAWHFVALGLLVALVQGGTQALSRSLFASLIPRHRTGEFFGLFGVGEKFAGIFGPLLYGLAIHWSGSAQGAILSVIPFFLVGGALLLRLDVEAGRRMAREAERDVRVVRKAGA
jgi:UMF1 family MFS transporter